MPKRKVTKCNSSDSEADYPNLSVKKKIKRNNYGVNPKSELCKHITTKSCEFCSETFNNELHFLVHNAKHIIIPVEKLDTQITKIDTSQNDVSHNDITHINDNVSEDVDTILTANIDWLKPKEPLTIDSDNVLTTFTNDCKVNLEMLPIGSNNDNESDEVLQSFLRECEVDLGFKGFNILLDDSPTESVPITENIDDKSNCNYTIDSSDCISIADSEEIEHKIDIEEIPLPSPSELSVKTNTKKRRKKKKLPTTMEVAIHNAKSKAESIHYEELLEFQKYGCRFCNRHFFNRYELLFHHVNDHFKVICNFKQDVFTASPYFCDVCQSFFVRLNSWITHVKDSHPDKLEKVLRCKTCRQIYAFGKKRHKRMFHNDSIRHCKLCDKFNCKKHLTRKVKKKKAEFTCEVLINGQPIEKPEETELKTKYCFKNNAISRVNGTIKPQTCFVSQNVNPQVAKCLIDETTKISMIKKSKYKDISISAAENVNKTQCNASNSENLAKSTKRRGKSKKIIQSAPKQPNTEQCDDLTGVKDPTKSSFPKNQHRKRGRGRPINAVNSIQNSSSFSSIVGSGNLENNESVIFKKKRDEILKKNDIGDNEETPVKSKNTSLRNLIRQSTIENQPTNQYFTEYKETMLAQKRKLEARSGFKLTWLCGLCYRDACFSNMYNAKIFLFFEHTPYNLKCEDCDTRLAKNLVHKEDKPRIIKIVHEEDTPPLLKVVNQEKRPRIMKVDNNFPLKGTNIFFPVTEPGSSVAVVVEPIANFASSGGVNIISDSNSQVVSSVKKNNDECILGM